MKTKKFQQIALPLTGLFIFSLPSCAIKGNSEAPSSSFSSFGRVAEYNLVSSTLEGMKETFNAFFKETFECNKMIVKTYTDPTLLSEYTIEYISGTTCNRKHYGFDYINDQLCGGLETSEEWAFILDDGRKIGAIEDFNYYYEDFRGDVWYDEGEDEYNFRYKRYMRDINLPESVKGQMEFSEEHTTVNPEIMANPIFKTYLSTPKNGYSDLLLNVSVRDEKKGQVDLATLEATAENGLLKKAIITSHGTIVEDGFWRMDEELWREEYTFSYPDELTLKIPDMTGWHVMSSAIG